VQRQITVLLASRNQRSREILARIAGINPDAAGVRLRACHDNQYESEKGVPHAPPSLRFQT
jgi:hypothetical protein